MKIYTKTGDKGTTSLYSGERRPKDDAIFDALGAVDELNAHIGLSREHLLSLMQQTSTVLDSESHEKFAERLSHIQSRLLDLGSCIATPAESTTSEVKLNRVKFDNNNIVLLEEWIDQMDEHLPALKNFILPGGGLTSSQLHVARTVCRRAERNVVHLTNNGAQGLEDVQKFLNRLSDYLFMAARFAAKMEGKEEVIYQK